MKRNIFIMSTVILLLIIATIPMVKITRTPAKTYEQGLWDGYNRTMRYINGQEFHVGDTLKIKVSTADSLLHVNN